MRRCGLVGVGVLAAALGLCGTAGADPITLSLLPPERTPGVGDNFEVSVFIANVTELFSYDIELRLSNTESIAFRDAPDSLDLPPNFTTEGDFLRTDPATGAAIPTFYFDDPVPFDATAPYSAIRAADFILDPIASVSGSGLLFQVLFTSIGVLPVDISFGDVSLNGVAFATTEDNALGTTIAPVPEPSSLTLMGVGLAAWYGRRRRRQRSSRKELASTV
jgi:hypothetical protein